MLALIATTPEYMTIPNIIGNCRLRIKTTSSFTFEYSKENLINVKPPVLQVAKHFHHFQLPLISL
jgi:hypothetical protein